MISDRFSAAILLRSSDSALSFPDISANMFLRHRYFLSAGLSASPRLPIGWPAELMSPGDRRLVQSEQAGVRHTMFSSEAYLNGRCVFLVTNRTSLVTNENMSSIEMGFCILAKKSLREWTMLSVTIVRYSARICSVGNKNATTGSCWIEIRC